MPTHRLIQLKPALKYVGKFYSRQLSSSLSRLILKTVDLFSADT